jgi:hypothetical protein
MQLLSRPDGCVRAAPDAFQAAFAAFFVVDVGMLVTQDLNFIDHLARTMLDAGPASLAEMWIEDNIGGRSMANNREVD